LPFAYDANGNMTTNGPRALTWNNADRLASVGSTTFAYDETLGDRIRKTDASGTTIYLSDDYEISPAGVATKYFSVGEVLAYKLVGTTRSGTYWIHTDHLNSVNAITDANGADVRRRNYLPYGAILTDYGSHEESRGYTAQRMDDTGLIYLHARYYDPKLGRFISPDPIENAPGIIGMNSYAYANNNPVNFSDVGGLQPSASTSTGGSKPKGKTECPPDCKDSGVIVDTNSTFRVSINQIYIPDLSLTIVGMDPSALRPQSPYLFTPPGYHSPMPMIGDWGKTIPFSGIDPEFIAEALIGSVDVISNIIPFTKAVKGVGSLLKAGVSAFRARGTLTSLNINAGAVRGIAPGPGIISNDGLKFTPHVNAKYFKKRGWTEAEVADRIENSKTQMWVRDQGHTGIGDARRNDPAVMYINSNNDYVIVNSRTGEVIQLSGRHDPKWAVPDGAIRYK
jgi:RHS repeat-associated protein